MACQSDLAGLEGTAVNMLGFLVFKCFRWSWCLNIIQHKFGALLFI